MQNSTEKSRDVGRRVTVDLTPAAAREVERLRSITGLSTADVFRHALALFRHYVDARCQGRQLVISDPKNDKNREVLELPLILEVGSGK